VVTPPSAWTGESLISGSYVHLPAGAGLRWQVPPADQPRLVLPVVDLRPGVPARTVWHSDAGPLGEVDHARVGAQGNSPAPGALLPVTLPRELAAHATELTAQATAGNPATVDAVMLEPLVSRLTLAGDRHSTTLLRSAGQTAQVTAGSTGPATVEVYDAAGALHSRHTSTATQLRVTVLPGGFTLVRR
jgi:hypothetical protein